MSAVAEPELAEPTNLPAYRASPIAGVNMMQYVIGMIAHFEPKRHILLLSAPGTGKSRTTLMLVLFDLLDVLLYRLGLLPEEPRYPRVYVIVYNDTHSTNMQREYRAALGDQLYDLFTTPKKTSGVEPTLYFQRRTASIKAPCRVVLDEVQDSTTNDENLNVNLLSSLVDSGGKLRDISVILSTATLMTNNANKALPLWDLLEVSYNKESKPSLSTGGVQVFYVPSIEGERTRYWSGVIDQSFYDNPELGDVESNYIKDYGSDSDSDYDPENAKTWGLFIPAKNLKQAMDDRAAGRTNGRAADRGDDESSEPSSGGQPFEPSIEPSVMSVELSDEMFKDRRMPPIGLGLSAVSGATNNAATISHSLNKMRNPESRDDFTSEHFLTDEGCRIPADRLSRTDKPNNLARLAKWSPKLAAIVALHGWIGGKILVHAYNRAGNFVGFRKDSIDGEYPSTLRRYLWYVPLLETVPDTSGKRGPSGKTKLVRRAVLDEKLWYYIVLRRPEELAYISSLPEHINLMVFITDTWAKSHNYLLFRAIIIIRLLHHGSTIEQSVTRIHRLVGQPKEPQKIIILGSHHYEIRGGERVMVKHQEHTNVTVTVAEKVAKLSTIRHHMRMFSAIKRFIPGRDRTALEPGSVAIREGRFYNRMHSNEGCEDLDPFNIRDAVTIEIGIKFALMGDRIDKTSSLYRAMAPSYDIVQSLLTDELDTANVVQFSSKRITRNTNNRPNGRKAKRRVRRRRSPLSRQLPP
jgi:hypothetical protein